MDNFGNITRLNAVQHIAGRLEHHPRRTLRPRASVVYRAPDEGLRSYLERAGFWEASKIRPLPNDMALVSAFVERWRPETHTFHLPTGECTITLQDVAYHLGVSVDGLVVSGCTGDFQRHLHMDIWDMSAECLGQIPNPIPQGQRTTVLITWLRDVVLPLPNHPTEADLLHSTRACILLMIAGLVMPDTSDSRVHLRLLQLLRDLDECGQYSWGSAVLCKLYRGLCRATDYSSSSIFGSMTLLQSWIWFRLSRLLPGVDYGIRFPLSRRWEGFYVPTEDKEQKLIRIRALIDTLEYHKFEWMPYVDQCVVDVFPHILLAECAVWTFVPSLICFAFIEWHSTDRVLRQFGGHQHLSGVPLCIDGLHPRDARGKTSWWPVEYRSWHNLWDTRHDRLIQIGDLYRAPIVLPSVEYYEWYRLSARRFLSDQPGVYYFVDPFPAGAIPYVPPVLVPPLPDHYPLPGR